VTSAPALSTVGAGGCAQQYTAAINNLNGQAITANNVGLASNATGAAASVTNLVAQNIVAGVAAGAFTAMSVGLGVTVGYGVAPLPTAAGIPGSVAAAAAAGTLAGNSTASSVAYVAGVVGAVATVAGVASQITAQVFTTDAFNLTNYTAGLPGCEGTFTGTVAVTAGGVNVSGDSIFQGNVGITQSLNVDNLNVNTIMAAQGISAFGGAITIGDPSLTTYSSGITIGGGAISGAGTGGLQAFTGDVTAIAIGNNAQATEVGSLALGLNSSATGVSAVAVGSGAFAASTNSVAIGAGAVALSSVAVGGGAQATGTNSTAVGDNATASGNFSSAFGNNSVASAGNSVALGNGSVADQPNTVSVGSPGSERRITNVAKGVNPTDAVNVSQLNDVRRQSFRGIAGVAALTSAAPGVPGKTTINLGVGGYQGFVAGSVTASRVTEDGKWNFNAGVGISSGQPVYRAGVGFSF
jgi:hypothetical protein